MQSRQVVIQEAQAFVEERADQAIPTSWLVQHIFDRHKESFTDDFGRGVAFDAFRSYVREVMQKYKLDAKREDEPDPQMVLPGYKRVQKRYLVTRNRESISVPAEQLTRLEVDDKIGELRRMGHGCFEHADELGKYLAERLGTSKQGET